MTTDKPYHKPDGTVVDADDIDWTEYDSINDEEAERRALADPDAPPLDQDELRKFKRVNPDSPKRGIGND